MASHTKIRTAPVDLLVDDRVLVEVKSTEVSAPPAQRQLLNYCRATSFQVGLLLHLGPKPRFYRLVHSQKPSSALIRRIGADSQFRPLPNRRAIQTAITRRLENDGTAKS